MNFSYQNVISSTRFNQSKVLDIANKLTICQIVFVIFDIGCNLIVDSTSSDPMIGFIVFIIQVVAILANLISFLMITSHDAIQVINLMHPNKFMEAKTRVHNLSALVTLAYLILTIFWHIWSLRRSWPAAGDQFSYTFLPKRNFSQNATDTLPFGSGFDNLKENREFYMLWSPGFIALYTSQRTASLIYYGIHLLSMSVLDNLQHSLASLPSVTNKGQVANDLRMRSISAFMDAAKQESKETGSLEFRPAEGRKCYPIADKRQATRQKRFQSTSNDFMPFDPNPTTSGHDAMKRASWESEQTLPIGTQIHTRQTLN